MLHQMVKVQDFLEMLHGRQTLQATQKEPRAQNKHMAAVGSISVTAEIVKPSWSNFQHDGAAAWTLLERSPVPPDWTAKELSGGQTEE